jgi:hypothetical protein
MASSTLFALAGDAHALQRQIDTAAELLFSDDPEEVATATSTLEALLLNESNTRQALAAKADAWCWVIDGLRAQSAARREHAARLTALASQSERQADALQDRLVSILERVDHTATSWKFPAHTLSSRKVTAVELDPLLDPSDLPLQFQRSKTTISADKTELKAALSRGELIEGALLVQRRSWRIG